MLVNNYNIGRLTDRICEPLSNCKECPLYPYKYPTQEREERGDPTFWCDDASWKDAEISATHAFQDLLKTHPELRKNFTAEDIREIGVMKGTIV